MSRELKKTFTEKMEISPSKHFDSDFSKKLLNEKSHKSSVVKWWSWAAGSALTLVVFLFVFQQNYDLAYPHQQYVHSVIEMDEASDDFVSDDSFEETIDLTSPESDEI